MVCPGPSWIIASPAEERVRPAPAPYRSPGGAHLGLGAGRCDEWARGESLEQAPSPHPAKRALTGRAAVKALGLTGLGGSPHARSLVPRFCPHTPPARRLSPRVPPAPLPEAALGRALHTLSGAGGTAREPLRAAPAAQRLDLSPTARPLDRTSLPVDGCETRDAPAAAPVGPSATGATQACGSGASRPQRAFPCG